MRSVIEGDARTGWLRPHSQHSIQPIPPYLVAAQVLHITARARLLTRRHRQVMILLRGRHHCLVSRRVLPLHEHLDDRRELPDHRQDLQYPVQYPDRVDGKVTDIDTMVHSIEGVCEILRGIEVRKGVDLDGPGKPRRPAAEQTEPREEMERTGETRHTALARNSNSSVSCTALRNSANAVTRGNFWKVF